MTNLPTNFINNIGQKGDAAYLNLLGEEFNSMVLGSVNGTPTELTLWTGKQTELDAITTKDANTLYAALPWAHYFDDFNRANNASSPGASWTTRRGTMGISSNAMSPVGTNTGGAASFNSVMATNNHKVAITVRNVTVSDVPSEKTSFQVYAASGTDKQCLLLSAWNSMILVHVTGWGSTVVSILQQATTTVVDGDVLSLERSGTQFIARQNGIARIVYDDTAGLFPLDSSHRMVGAGGFNASTGVVAVIDDFTADDI